MHPLEVACARVCEKSAFLTYLSIVFNSLLLRANSVCTLAHLITCTCPFDHKARFNLPVLSNHNSSLAQDIELKFCPSLKKININTIRKYY